jgi:hypothetical protein
MNNQVNKTEETTNKFPTSFTFFLACPHCQKTLTSQDFDNSHFTIAHLQTYFQQKEQEYKQQLLNQLTQDPNLFPAYQQIKREAIEQPKIQKSFVELEKEITALEIKLEALNKQYKTLQEKSSNMKLSYMAGGLLGGSIGGIAI